MEPAILILLAMSFFIGISVGVLLNEIGRRENMLSGSKYIKFRGRLVRVLPRRHGFTLIPGGKGRNRERGDK